MGVGVMVGVAVGAVVGVGVAGMGEGVASTVGEGVIGVGVSQARSEAPSSRLSSTAFAFIFLLSGRLPLLLFYPIPGRLANGLGACVAGRGAWGVSPNIPLSLFPPVWGIGPSAPLSKGNTEDNSEPSRQSRRPLRCVVWGDGAGAGRHVRPISIRERGAGADRAVGRYGGWWGNA